MYVYDACWFFMYVVLTVLALDVMDFIFLL